jgi:hypothetical protein
MSNQNSDLQRKAGFFHSLGKVITEYNNTPGNEDYKSAHNVRSSEVWMDEIPIAVFGSASLYSDGVVVRQIGSASGNYNDPLNQFDSQAYLYPLSQTNYQTWFLDTGTPSATVDGFLPSNEWVKPLINPSDVPDSTGAPSLGYQFRIYKNDGTFISYGAAYYDVDYFAGLIRFDVGKTPIDNGSTSGLGFQFSQSSFQAILPVTDATRKAYIQSTTTGGPRAVAWQYVGQRLSNYTFTGGGSVSFSDSLTIGFTQSGITYSAYIIDGSLTASSLNTGLSGGATAGYVLSNTGDGNFAWVPAGAGGSSGTSGVSTSVEFYNTDTITFATQSIPGGLSASATINLGSLTASHLNTGLSGGPTAGYVLSNTGDGNFAWVAPGAASTNLSVSDYNNGTTFSNIQNIIFRGGLVTTPNYGGTAMGVLAGAPTSSNSVTVWIPAPPAAVYASHFNTTDGNTTGTVTRTLTTASVRISSPTSEGVPFEVGSSPNTSWASQSQPATTGSTPTFQTSGLVTGFSANSGGDARIIVDVFRGNGTATFSTYTTPTLYQNATHTNSAGISVTIGSYAVDDSGFPSIYTTKYKASVSVSVNMATIFAAYSLDGGRYSVRIKFITDTATDGGSTYTATSADVFYDTNLNSPPSISGSTTIIESTNSSNILTKHISGVEYYVANSQFELTTTGINNLNRNTQGFSNGTSKNFTVTGTNYGLPPRDLQAWAPSYGTFVGWSNLYTNTGITYSYTSWAISSSATYRYRGAGAVASAQPFEPWASGSAVSSTGASVLIDLVSDNSTRLGDSFTGEDKRLVRGSSTYSVWDSTTPLGTSISNQTGTGPFCDACVVGGYLVRPDKYHLSASLTTLQPNLASYKPDKFGANPNYSSHTQIATYHRMWYTADVRNISSFKMTFSGQWPVSYPNALSALLNSQLKIYVRRVSSPSGNFGPTSAPLSLHGNEYNSGSPANPFNDGNSGVDTPGSLIRVNSSSGNVIDGTFGIYPANVGFWMELQIVDPDIKLDYINVTLNFSSGSPTTDSSAVGAG